MKRLPMIVLLLVGTMFALQETATCPYDGVTANATGHYKTVHTANGEATSCEYAHPVNVQDASQGRHVFWQICD